MGRRHRHIPLPELDSGKIQSLEYRDIRAIIRGATDLILAGGRSLLTKILKGSKSKDVLSRQLEMNPSYGFYRNLKLEEVQHRVDWMIESGYLSLRLDGRLPLLVYTDRGLDIAEDIIAAEWFGHCATMVEAGGPFLMTFLTEKNRSTVFKLLDLISSERNTAFIPLLEAWREIEVKKVRARITQVITAIAAGTEAPMQAFQRFRRCLVDESVSQDEPISSIAHAEGIEFDEQVWIAGVCPGIQDVGILTQLLDTDTCLFTSDRALHNAALERGNVSFYLAPDGTLSRESLPGIKLRGVLRKDVEVNPKVDQLVSKEASLLYPLLAPESECARKKLRTKRRRIRNYFGGAQNMRDVAITLSAKLVAGGKMLIGMRIRIIAHSTGLKALDASERYIMAASEDRVAAYCQCLSQLVLLDLEKVPCTVYFDADALARPTEFMPSRHEPLYQLLAAEVASLDFVATTKGEWLLRLRDKLQSLAAKPTNEIVQEDLPQIEASL